MEERAPSELNLKMNRAWEGADASALTPTMDRTSSGDTVGIFVSASTTPRPQQHGPGTHGAMVTRRAVHALSTQHSAEMILHLLLITDL